MGRLAIAAGLTARITYALLAAYVTLSAVEAVANAARSLSAEFSDMLLRGALLLALLAALSKRLAAIPLLSIVALAVLEPSPHVALMAIILAVLYNISTLHSARRLKVVVASRRRLAAGVLLTVAVIAVPGVVFAPAPIYLDKLIAAADRLVERATGELSTVERLLAETLLFRVIVAGLILGLVYKTVYSTLDLAVSALLPPAYARVESEAMADSERITLERFRGPQYSVLESASSWILAFLFAPMIYDTLNAGLAEIPVEIDPVYRALASTFVGLLLGWMTLRVLTVSLVRSASVEALLKPRAAAPLLVGLLIASGIIAVYLVVGGNPAELVRTAVTGTPGEEDPLARAVNTAPGEDYYRSLARLVDLLVRLFWGG